MLFGYPPQATAIAVVLHKFNMLCHAGGFRCVTLCADRAGAEEILAENPRVLASATEDRPPVGFDETYFLAELVLIPHNSLPYSVPAFDPVTVPLQSVQALLAPFSSLRGHGQIHK